MRSAVERLVRRAHRSVLLAAMWLYVAIAAPVHAQFDGAPPSEQEIAIAIEQLKADPNLRSERLARSLRWKNEDRDRQAEAGGGWLHNLFLFFAESGRVLMMVVGGIFVIALVVVAVRALRNVRSGPTAAKTETPTHVRDLDIRPESLPNDIGAAVLETWARGERRAALALLYRGLLSRLVHVHGVAIRDSSTEGECLELAARTLEPVRHRYVAQVIALWQRATYGGREPDAYELQALCSGFDRALERAAPSRDPA
ncbi:MAG TPA: DUF4129 domain-containing protein [Steroidobacteraceae bacterium]